MIRYNHDSIKLVSLNKLITKPLTQRSYFPEFQSTVFALFPVKYYVSRLYHHE